MLSWARKRDPRGKDLLFHAHFEKSTGPPRVALEQAFFALALLLSSVILSCGWLSCTL